MEDAAPATAGSGKSRRAREARDAHLAEAIEVSSNVAMAKFSERLSPVEQYRAAAGLRVRRADGRRVPVRVPRGAASPGAVAAGVEPGQHRDGLLVRGDGAAARGGVRRHRQRRRPADTDADPGGARPRTAPCSTATSRSPSGGSCLPEVAAQLREFLRGASGIGGTGSRAQLAAYGVLGKTGTARRVRNGGYVDEYVASFASMFPADDPQLVVVVKIDKPKGGLYYGGDAPRRWCARCWSRRWRPGECSIDRARLLGGRPAEVATTAPKRASAQPVTSPRIVVPWPYRLTAARREPGRGARGGRAQRPRGGGGPAPAGLPGGGRRAGHGERIGPCGREPAPKSGQRYVFRWSEHRGLESTADGASARRPAGQRARRGRRPVGARDRHPHHRPGAALLRRAGHHLRRAPLRRRGGRHGGGGGDGRADDGRRRPGDRRDRRAPRRQRRGAGPGTAIRRPR